MTANQLDSLSGVFRRLLTGVLEANRSVLGEASAGELAVAQLLEASGIEAATGSFGRTDIDGDLRGNRATVSRAVGGRFDGQRFEGDDFHISGSSENEIFHRINSLDGKLYNCKYVTEYCFPKAPLIDQTSCPECFIQQESGNFSAEATALVKRCQHGCEYTWQLGDVSGSCSSGSIGEGGQRTVSCPVSASLGAGERRRTFIDLVAVNANDTTKRTSHRFAVDWTYDRPEDPFDESVNPFVCTHGGDYYNAAGDEGCRSTYGAVGAKVNPSAITRNDTEYTVLKSEFTEVTSACTTVIGGTSAIADRGTNYSCRAKWDYSIKHNSTGKVLSFHLYLVSQSGPPM